jgi:hypothetical protein
MQRKFEKQENKKKHVCNAHLYGHKFNDKFNLKQDMIIIYPDSNILLYCKGTFSIVFVGDLILNLGLFRTVQSVPITTKVVS